MGGIDRKKFKKRKNCVKKLMRLFTRKIDNETIIWCATINKEI